MSPGNCPSQPLPIPDQRSRPSAVRSNPTTTEVFPTSGILSNIPARFATQLNAPHHPSSPTLDFRFSPAGRCVYAALMAFESYADFVAALEHSGELIRIKQPVATELEITALADSEMKKPGGGKAL